MTDVTTSQHRLRQSTAPRGIVTSLPVLPSIAHTRDGQRIRPVDDVWVLRKRKHGGDTYELDWTSFTSLSPRMVHLAKVILAGRLPQYAAMTTRNDFDTLCRFDAWLKDVPFDWSDISFDLGKDWLTHGLTTATAGNDFARLRDLYRFGVEALRHTDFSAATLLELETVRAPGNAKGNAVRSGDPEQGYFTPREVDLIIEALGKELGTAEQRATVWLALELGRNALQYTLLSNADLQYVSVVEDGTPSRLYQVQIRRIKKRTVNDEKDGWPISTALGDFLTSLRQGRDTDPLLWWLIGDKPEAAMRDLMGQWARAANLISPRTGRRLTLNARRFRVTLLTNAADEGASAEHLAMLAGHSDLQNIKVYIDRSPLFLLRIREKVDAIYDPMVRRFKGRFMTTDEAVETQVQVIPGVAAQFPLLDVGGIGVCGRTELCRLAPPLTCYTCEDFIAFRDGPHVQVVVALEQSMRQMNARVGLQIANTLAAAREVVARIQDDALPRGVA